MKPGLKEGEAAPSGDRGGSLRVWQRGKGQRLARHTVTAWLQLAVPRAVVEGEAPRPSQAAGQSCDLLAGFYGRTGSGSRLDSSFIGDRWLLEEM